MGLELGLEHLEKDTNKQGSMFNGFHDHMCLLWLRKGHVSGWFHIGPNPKPTEGSDGHKAQTGCGTSNGGQKKRK